MMGMSLLQWDAVHSSLIGKMRMETINMSEGLIKEWLHSIFHRLRF